MKKILFLLGVIIFVTSCSSDDIESSSLPKSKQDAIDFSGISVVKLVDYEPTQLRASNYDTSSLILRFSDETAYNKTVDALKEMSIDEQVKFYDQIGFESASVQLLNADNELDKIFDIEDDSRFLQEYSRFQEKHNNQFVYNTEDTYDLSPYLPYSDESLKLVGDVKGRVVIGEKLVKPNDSKPVYHEFFDEENFNQVSENIYIDKESLTTRAYEPMPYEPTFLGYKNATMMIKKGKYQSTMSFGRLPDVESGSLIVRFASQKKKRFWKRRHPTVYSGKFKIDNGNVIPVVSNISKEKAFINMRMRRPDGKFHLQMFDFTSGCCEGVYGKTELDCYTN